MVNIVALSGHLTDNPKKKEIKGKDLIEFTIAFNTYKGKDKPLHANFIRCEAWGATARFLEKLEKGDAISIQGELAFQSWKDQKGEYQSKVYVNVTDGAKHKK